MSLKAIQNKRLYQQVADQITELIRKGHWSPGDRLPAEREMAQELGVSRPTVREAIIVLEMRRMVEVKTGAGIFVTDDHAGPAPRIVGDDPGPSPFELMDARRIIEGETAAIAAGKISEKEIAGLRDAIEKMEKDVAAGRQEVSKKDDGDLLFHSRIAAASGNVVLVTIVDQLWEGMRRPMFTSIGELVKLPSNAGKAVKSHKIILERICARDPEGARLAMQNHLDQVKAVLLENGTGMEKEESDGR